MFFLFLLFHWKNSPLMERELKQLIIQTKEKNYRFFYWSNFMEGLWFGDGLTGSISTQ